MRQRGEPTAGLHVVRESPRGSLARRLLPSAGMTTRTQPSGKPPVHSEPLTVPLLVILWTTMTVGFIMVCVVLLMR